MASPVAIRSPLRRRFSPRLKKVIGKFPYLDYISPKERSAFAFPHDSRPHDPVPSAAGLFRGAGAARRRSDLGPILEGEP
jgi:hypothetical protein